MAPYNIDVICLAGFMRILVPDFIERAPPIMNIHPALLPSFGGKGMYGMKVHRAVYASGVKFSGPTVHFVTPKVDSGPIIVQRIVRIEDDDDPEAIAKKVLIEEHQAYPEALKHFCEDALVVHGNRVIRKN